MIEESLGNAICRALMDTYSYCTPDVYHRIMWEIEHWLKLNQNKLFIDTVSTMDCEMSAVRTETFEALLADLKAPTQVSRVELQCNSQEKKVEP